MTGYVETPLELSIKQGDEVCEFCTDYFLTIKGTVIAANDSMEPLIDLATDIQTTLYDHGIQSYISISLRAFNVHQVRDRNA